MSLIFTYHGDSKPGLVRTNNEDTFYIGENAFNDKFGVTHNILLAIVADGMGGQNAGEVASAIALEEMQDFIFSRISQYNLDDDSLEKLLKDAILSAHNRIVAKALTNASNEGMGTTACVALIYENKLFYAWSGDSRIYLFNPIDKKIDPITKLSGLSILTADHSVVWQEIVKGNASIDNIEKLHNSNIIVQSLGALNHPPKPDAGHIKLLGKEKIVLCSDGLNLHLPVAIVKSKLELNISPESIVNQLMNDVYQEGAQDNVTIAIANIELHKDATIAAPLLSKSEPSSMLQKLWWLIFPLIGCAVFLIKKNFFNAMPTLSQEISSHDLNEMSNVLRHEDTIIPISDTAILYADHLAADTAKAIENINSPSVETTSNPTSSKSKALSKDKENKKASNNIPKKNSNKSNHKKNYSASSKSSELLTELQINYHQEIQRSKERNEEDKYTKLTTLDKELRLQSKNLFNKQNLVDHSNERAVANLNDEMNLLYKKYKNLLNEIKF